jgi:multidrug efflux pump subunit AcrB
MHLLTPPQVARWLQSAFGAFPVATLRDEEEEVDLVVRLDDESRSDASEIASLTLVTPDGASVRLGDIATIAPGRGPAMIRHKDRERTVKVTAQIEEGETSAEVNRRLLERLEPLIRAAPDVRFELGGEYERTNESLASLANAFIIAMLLVYTILATQFRSLIQPLVVMAAIPLSFIGVVIGFFVSGAPIGMIALIGVVGLAGIVVNDSLVLVDFINQRRSRGMELDEAIVTASKLRLRPIFLTSITTVAGLFPLALAGEAAPLLSPMATAIAWGLSFATVLTLILVPCLYRIAAGASHGLGRLLGPLTRWATDPGDAAEEPTVAE